MLAWVGAFHAAGRRTGAPPAFVAGTESGFATFQTQCAQCHGNPNVDRAPTPTALREMTPEKIYDALTTGVMQTAGVGAERRAEEGASPSSWPAVRSAAPNGRRREHGLPVPHEPAAVRSGARSGVERLESATSRTRASSRRTSPADRRAGAEAEAEVGVRISHRRVGQRAADDRRRPRLRRQRQRLRVFDRREDGLRLLVVRERLDHPQRVVVGAGEGPGRREVRRVLRRRPRQRLRARRAGRPAAVEDESRFALRRAHHGRHPLLRRQALRAGLVVRGVQQRQSRLLRAARRAARRRARREHRQADLENLGRARRAEAVQDDGERRDVVRAGRRRRLELADDRSGEARGVLRHRRRDDRAVRRRRRTPIMAVDLDTGKYLWSYQATENDVFMGGCNGPNAARHARSRWGRTWTSATRRF